MEQWKWFMLKTSNSYFSRKSAESSILLTRLVFDELLSSTNNLLWILYHYYVHFYSNHWICFRKTTRTVSDINNDGIWVKESTCLRKKKKLIVRNWRLYTLFALYARVSPKIYSSFAVMEISGSLSISLTRRSLKTL